jgi:hypothetical protein
VAGRAAAPAPCGRALGSAAAAPLRSRRAAGGCAKRQCAAARPQLPGRRVPARPACFAARRPNPNATPPNPQGRVLPGLHCHPRPARLGLRHPLQVRHVQAAHPGARRHRYCEAWGPGLAAGPLGAGAAHLVDRGGPAAAPPPRCESRANAGGVGSEERGVPHRPRGCPPPDPAKLTRPRPPSFTAPNRTATRPRCRTSGSPTATLGRWEGRGGVRPAGVPGSAPRERAACSEFHQAAVHQSLPIAVGGQGRKPSPSPLLASSLPIPSRPPTMPQSCTKKPSSYLSDQARRHPLPHRLWRQGGGRQGRRGHLDARGAGATRGVKRGVGGEGSRAQRVLLRVCAPGARPAAHNHRPSTRHSTPQVMAVAFDNPIPGWRTPTVTNLRLWDAEPLTEFDLQAFNAGEYEAVSGSGAAFLFVPRDALRALRAGPTAAAPLAHSLACLCRAAPLSPPPVAASAPSRPARPACPFASQPLPTKRPLSPPPKTPRAPPPPKPISPRPPTALPTRPPATPRRPTPSPRCSTPTTPPPRARSCA